MPALIGVGAAILMFVLGGVFIAGGHTFVGIIVALSALPAAIVAWMAAADRWS